MDLVITRIWFWNQRQERDIESVADHLSHLENKEVQESLKEIEQRFPDEQILNIESREPWCANIVNYLVWKQWLEDYNAQ